MGMERTKAEEVEFIAYSPLAEMKKDEADRAVERASVSHYVGEAVRQIKGDSAQAKRLRLALTIARKVVQDQGIMLLTLKREKPEFKNANEFKDV